MRLQLQAGRDDYTTPPFRPWARPGWPTCTTKPGVMRWSAPLAGPAARGGSGPGQCAGACESRDERLCRQPEKGDQGWLRSTPYSSLLAADEARDAAALAAVAWQMYGQLVTTAADLGTLRARFRVYAAAPHASGRRRSALRGAETDACAAAA